jgi:hypothetical protein
MHPGQVVSYGNTPLVNHGDTTVTIDRVGLADSRGLRQVAAWVVPSHTVHGNSFLYGVLRGYPPTPSLSPGVDWPARQRARGAVLRPMKKSQQATLLLVIKMPGGKGSASGVTIWYRAGGTSYYRKIDAALLLTNRACPANL